MFALAFTLLMVAGILSPSNAAFLPLGIALFILWREA